MGVRGPKPCQGAVEKQHIGERRGEVAHQALAVAPEPVELIGRVTPTVTLPGLQRDPSDPARLLAYRRFELTGKVLTGGDECAASPEDRNEKLATPEPVH